MSLQDDVLSIEKKIDDNWFQGYLGDKKGIFPVIYVTLLEGTCKYVIIK